MPVALDPRETFDYVLTRDRELPEEQQTIWELRGLTVTEQAAIEDNMLAGAEMRMLVGSRRLKILRYGLRGVRNYVNARGVPVLFETVNGHPKHVTDEFLSTILQDDRTELADVIYARGELDDDEKE